MECLSCKYCKNYSECEEDGTTKECTWKDCGSCPREYEERCEGFLPAWEGDKE